MIEYNERLVKDLSPKKFKKVVKFWIYVLVAILIAAIYLYTVQLKKGLVVTNMNDYFSWGVYTTNFVFFVSMSFVGSLTGAFLRAAKFTWREPVVRITEMLAVIAIIMASISIILDMGRPDRLLNMFKYGRIQSPIIWDVFIVTSYFIISIIILYISLIPDFSILKNHFKEKPRLSKLYNALSINWKGVGKQQILRNVTKNIVTSLIIPISLLHQTSNGWLFATTYRVGWNSAVIGPYFIIGAILLGFATIIALMYVLMSLNRLERYITPFHFNKMASGMGISAAVYLYFNFSIYFLPIYSSTTNEKIYRNELFSGNYAISFWLVFIGISLIPTALLFIKKWHKPFNLFVISMIVIVASWYKRYLIIIPTLEKPFLPIDGVPKEWFSYTPSFTEIFITFATVTTAILILILFIRFIPIIAIHDYAISKKLYTHVIKRADEKNN